MYEKSSEKFCNLKIDINNRDLLHMLEKVEPPLANLLGEKNCEDPFPSP